MMTPKRKKILPDAIHWILVLTVISSLACQQSASTQSSNTSSKIQVSDTPRFLPRPSEFDLATSSAKEFPIVYGRKNDGLPEMLKIHGVITSVNLGGPLCGGISTAGVMKVRLLEKIEGYPHENVFLIVGCFADIINHNEPLRWFGTQIKLNVEKAYKSKYDLITNTINSDGIPFYYTWWGNVADGIKPQADK